MDVQINFVRTISIYKISYFCYPWFVTSKPWNVQLFIWYIVWEFQCNVLDILFLSFSRNFLIYSVRIWEPSISLALFVLLLCKSNDSLDILKYCFKMEILSIWSSVYGSNAKHNTLTLYHLDVPLRLERNFNVCAIIQALED